MVLLKIRNVKQGTRSMYKAVDVTFIKHLLTTYASRKFTCCECLVKVTLTALLICPNHVRWTCTAHLFYLYCMLGLVYQPIWLLAA